MGCNCGKKKVAMQPKKVIKPNQPTTTTDNKRTRRIIRRAAR